MRAVVARWWSVVSFGCSSFSVSGGLSQWLVLCVAGLMGDGMSSGSGNEKAGLASLRSSISVLQLRIMTMARSMHCVTCQASECNFRNHVLDHGM